MDPIQLKSGHLLELGIPDFGPSRELFKTLARELRDVNIELDSLDLKTIQGKDVNQFKNVILQILGSDAIEACVFKCAEKSLLEGEKIVLSTFSKPEMRPDYLPVAWEVIKLTLTPFFAGLEFRSSTSAAPTQKNPP